MPLNKDSVYIRRDFAGAQTVNTDLNFRGNLTVPTPTADNNPVTKKYVDDLKAVVVADTLQALPNTIEAITKEKYIIHGYNGRVEASGSPINSIQSYSGIGRILFMDTNKRPLVPCGWSYGEGYNADTGYGTFYGNIKGTKQIYLTLQQGDDFEQVQIAGTRKCEYPLSADDLAYFQGLGKPVICVNCEDFYNYHLGASDNWYDWSNPIFAFKTMGQNFQYTSSTNYPVGILCAYANVSNCNMSFWIEQDGLDSLKHFKDNVIGMTFGITTACDGVNQEPYRYFYGCSKYQLTRVKNDKFMDMDCIVGDFSTTDRIAFANLTMDETLNDVSWNANTLAGNGCSLLLKEAFVKRIKYNATNKKYEVV